MRRRTAGEAADCLPCHLALATCRAAQPHRRSSRQGCGAALLRWRLRRGANRRKGKGDQGDQESIDLAMCCWSSSKATVLVEDSCEVWHGAGQGAWSGNLLAGGQRDQVAASGSLAIFP